MYKTTNGSLRKETLIKSTLDSGRSKLGTCPTSRVPSCWKHAPHRYFSPYPLAELEVEESSTPQGSSTPTLRAPGVNRRPHVRTSDLLAGGLTRSQLTGEKSILWVCERCFKYMAEGSIWELHAVSAFYFGDEWQS